MWRRNAPIDEWAPPGGAIVQTIFGPGVLSNWSPGGPRYAWRSGFRYLVQPSDRAKHVLGASAPVPYVCLTKQQAREYAVSWWRSLAQVSKRDMCQHLFGDVNPYRLNALDAQELSFEIIVFMISPDMGTISQEKDLFQEASCTDKKTPNRTKWRFHRVIQ